MESSYRINANDLTDDFIASLKQLYKDKEIVIHVSDASDDETDYLLRSEANRKELLEAITDAKAGKNLIAVNLNELKAKIG